MLVRHIHPFSINRKKEFNAPHHPSFPFARILGKHRFSSVILLLAVYICIPLSQFVVVRLEGE
jgi:hypothetical protein